MRQCRSTARAVGWPAPCPTRIPRRLKPTQVIGGCRDFRIVGLPPCRRALAWRGWIVGSSEVTWPREHLVIQASPRPVLDYAKAVDGPGWYKGARVDVGRWVDVDGLRARWVFVPPAKNEGSAFAGHVARVDQNRTHLCSRLSRHQHARGHPCDGPRTCPSPPAGRCVACWYHVVTSGHTNRDPRAPRHADADHPARPWRRNDRSDTRRRAGCVAHPVSAVAHRRADRDGTGTPALRPLYPLPDTVPVTGPMTGSEALEADRSPTTDDLVYADSSALLKLLLDEPERDALESHLGSRPTLMSSGSRWSR